jgi:hypothetical protein
MAKYILNTNFNEIVNLIQKANQKVSPAVTLLPQETKNVFNDLYSLELLGLNDSHSERTLQKVI